ERAIAFRPAEPVVHAVFRGERCVQSVALQPRTVPLGEVRQAIGQPARTTRLERCEGLVEHAARYRVRVTMRGALIKSSRPSFHRAAERLFPDETRLEERRERERDRAAREDGRVVGRLIVLGRLALRTELQRAETVVRREAQERAAAGGERRSAAGVVTGIARERGIVHRERKPADAERIEPGVDQVSLVAHAGASQTTPSGGKVISTDAGCPSCGTASARTVSGLPTPEPPYSAASVLR